MSLLEECEQNASVVFAPPDHSFEHDEVLPIVTDGVEHPGRPKFACERNSALFDRDVTVWEIAEVDRIADLRHPLDLKGAGDHAYRIVIRVYGNIQMDLGQGDLQAIESRLADIRESLLATLKIGRSISRVLASRADRQQSSMSG